MDCLPYTDTKPHGASDFYFAVNAEFRFIYENFGREVWIDYLRQMGEEYFKPINIAWRDNGLTYLANYWEQFFRAEPNAEVDVEILEGMVLIAVKTCPAIRHLKKGKRNVLPEYCQHCYFLNSERARSAGLEMRLSGGNGSCEHRYGPKGCFGNEQDINRIERVD